MGISRDEMGGGELGLEKEEEERGEAPHKSIYPDPVPIVVTRARLGEEMVHCRPYRAGIP